MCRAWQGQGQRARQVASPKRISTAAGRTLERTKVKTITKQWAGMICGLVKEQLHEGLLEVRLG